MVLRVTYVAALLGIALLARTAASGAVARPKIARNAHRLPAAVQTYTIVDLGAPPVATYPASSPVGFNNTGTFSATPYARRKAIAARTLPIRIASFGTARATSI